MNYNSMHGLITDLPFDTMTSIYSNGYASIMVLRPSTLSKRFKNYNVNTNFQIFLQEENNAPFKPNHLRVMLDLKLRVREYPEAVFDLLKAFDNIFYGIDPLDAISHINHNAFSQSINSLDIIATLTQLFLIEQNIGYGDKSTFNPPSLYLQGWIRTFIYSDSEIDQLTYRICRNTPPSVKYTCEDNINHSKYNPNIQPLWYCD